MVGSKKARKDESEDAVFNENFGFSGDNSQLWKILSGSKMWDESTHESEDPSGTISGENKDGSESFESEMSHITHAISQTSTE